MRDVVICEPKRSAIGAFGGGFKTVAVHDLATAVVRDIMETTGLPGEAVDDVILANCYPFWEGCHIDYSLVYMKNMYYSVMRQAKGKRIVISETGWPNIGTAFESSEPSTENALRYFINAQQWSQQEDIEMMYFSSFDEAWKIDAEAILCVE